MLLREEPARPRYLQSGAGHQRVPGSATSSRRSRNSSYLSRRAGSGSSRCTSWGGMAAGQCGQAAGTRLSVTARRRYCCRQPRQERCEQQPRAGNASGGCGSRHRGHSSSASPRPSATRASSGSGAAGSGGVSPATGRGLLPKQPRRRRGPGTRVGRSMGARRGGGAAVSYGGQRGAAGPAAAAMARLLPGPRHGRRRRSHPQAQAVPLSLRGNRERD